jgi:uncharacterized protein
MMETDLERLNILSGEKETENEAFVTFLKQQDGDVVDKLVVHLTNEIEPKIDCMLCGNCCKSLMINVTEPEAIRVAAHLNILVDDFKEKYVEIGITDRMIMKTIPCSFLDDKKCSIYENRFEGCREFPNLQAPNFTKRLFTTMMHYKRCPIIFNVVEGLKKEMEFE